MTTRRKSLLGIAAALAIGLLATPLLLARNDSAGCPLGLGARVHGAAMFAHAGHGGLGQLGRLFRQLDLTDAQKDAMHDIHDAVRKQNETARQTLHEGFMDAAKVLVADPQNLAGARATLASREAAIQTLKENTLSAVSQALSVLTPEQRAKLAAHLDSHQRQIGR